MDIFQILALCVIATFYIVYLIKFIMQTKAGIKANALGKGKKPRETKAVERFLQVLIIILIITEIASIFWNDKMLGIESNLLMQILGVTIAVLGIIVFAISAFTMKKSWRAGVDEESNSDLITNGIYKFSRNPAFLGFYLLFIGIAVMYINPLLVAISLVTITLFHFQVFEEERYLTQAFGEQYETYKSNTNQYLGKNNGKTKTPKKTETKTSEKEKAE